ncbi:MAG TPA: hypothetical protein VEA69_21655 [Tepidisphaeraceae bacterium]|nr:hypothetical protein [Tepidisphaeraceae bacterium]
MSDPSPIPPGSLDVTVEPASASSPAAGPAASANGAGTGAPGSNEPYRLRGPRRRFTIVFGITATALITGLAVALLYFKWYRTEDYSVLIVAHAPAEWEGGTIVVTGPALGGDGLSAPITRTNNLVVRFHVPPGAYALMVHDKAGRPVARATNTLRAKEQWWPLRPPGTGTGTSRPAR